MKPQLKAPGTQRLKRKCDEPPSNFAFKIHLRRYNLMPTDLTVSALNRTAAGSALQRLTNKEYISDLGRVMQVEAC